jgi:putative addiction module component (TIGR02574 family)
MTQTAEQLKAQLLALSSRDRAELALFLLDSLDEERAGEVDLAWEAEVSRRAADIRRGTASGDPADSVLAELRAKYSKTVS